MVNFNFFGLCFAAISYCVEINLNRIEMENKVYKIE
jgi:hypothetical protein